MKFWNRELVRSGRAARSIAAVLVGLSLVGCSSTQKRRPAGGIFPTIDQCADHLQEICGLILQYYVDNRHLPATMEELQALAVSQAEPADLFVCPVSHVRYIYNPTGVPMSTLNPPARLIMYDAEPVHHGHRWGITVSPPMSGHPLICRVVVVPNNLNLNAAATQPSQ